MIYFKPFHDADLLLSKCEELFEDTHVCQNLLRCLSEQTIREDGIRRLKTREDGGMSSSILQNPSDPDATYRKRTSGLCGKF